jgi:hypothetical protein
MYVCTSKYHFYVLYEIQKDLEETTEKIGIFFKSSTSEFVGNLTSMLARSNLPALGTIREK